MVCHGKVRNGVIVLDSGAKLSEGMIVRVESVDDAAAKDAETNGKSGLFSMGRHAVSTGIPDLATNLDHHLYGHPKVSNE